MDYKELIEKLRGAGGKRYVLEAAHAIETLLEEREAAMKDLRRLNCEVCEYGWLESTEYPCCHCRFAGGTKNCWEWRGPKQRTERDNNA